MLGSGITLGGSSFAARQGSTSILVRLALAGKARLARLAKLTSAGKSKLRILFTHGAGSNDTKEYPLTIKMD